MDATHVESLYLSPRQAAKLLGVSAKTVYKLCNAGDLKARRVGSQWRIPRAVVERKKASKS